MTVELDFRASQSLSLEGLRNELSRHIQTARKQLRLDIEERITCELYTTDEFVLAAARLNEDYLMRECLMWEFFIFKGRNNRNGLVIRNTEFTFKPDKWHTPVGWVDTVYGKDLSYKNNDYPHYWAAVYSKEQQ